MLAKVLPALFHRKKAKSLLGKLKGKESNSPPYSLDLPDIVIFPELTLTRRVPRATGIVAGEVDWSRNKI